MMDYLTCLGCGRRFKNRDKYDKYQSHARRCKKLAKLLPLLYNVPTVSIQDLAHLEVRQLPDKTDWGVWNTNTNDWLRDKAGQIDSRVFQHNVKELLRHITTASIIR